MIDFDEHIDVYTTQMSLYTLDGIVMCRVFLMSLNGEALNLFTQLPSLSIDYFDTLIAKFGMQFTINQLHHLSSIALVNIFQEKGELLRSFMERFGKIALNIQNLSPEMWPCTTR